MLKKSKQYDFLKLFNWIGFILAFVIILNIGVCIFAISSVAGEASKYADSVVLSYIRELQQTLGNIDSNMSAEILFDDRLDIIESGMAEVESIQTLKKVKDLLGAWNKQYSFPVNHMIYLPNTDTAVTGYSSAESYIEWKQIEKDLISLIVQKKSSTSASSSSKWNVFKLNEKYYLLNYYHYKDRYMCCWIDIDSLIENMVVPELGEDCFFVVSSKEGEAYNNLERLKEKNISIPASLQEKTIFKKFMSSDMVINEKVKGTSFCLNAIVQGYSPVAGLLRIQIILLLIMGGFSVMCLTIMLYIKKTVIQPIQDFSHNVERLREDNNYTVETHYQISELKNASEILANLVNQIHGLKIDIYERTLERQKIKMDFLSLQIEPHFFLNCLNIIYHMVEIKKYKEVQNLSQCVSDYLRYIFKVREELALLGEEIEHAKKYLEIQKIRYRDGFEVVVEVEEEVLQWKVPPLMLHTFVENAIKHTIDWENKIIIHIRAKRVEKNGNSYIFLEVEDNGEGFDEETLRKLRNREDISEGEKRIGIMNAIQRVNLIYGEKGKIDFFNRPGSGAVVRIFIPTQELKKESE